MTGDGAGVPVGAGAGDGAAAGAGVGAGGVDGEGVVGDAGAFDSLSPLGAFGRPLFPWASARGGARSPIPRSSANRTRKERSITSPSCYFADADAALAPVPVVVLPVAVFEPVVVVTAPVVVPVPVVVPLVAGAGAGVVGGAAATCRAA